MLNQDLALSQGDEVYSDLAVNHAMAIHQLERSPLAQAERALIAKRKPKERLSRSNFFTKAQKAVVNIKSK